MAHFPVFLDARRSGLSALSPDRRMKEGRKHVKFLLAPVPLPAPIGEGDIDDALVTDQMVERFMALSPPLAFVVPEYLTIVKEIERAYVLGLYFSALSAACVAIERTLNMARMKLHPHHSIIGKLWGKGPSNHWQPNIDAIDKWGYIDHPLALELADIYSKIRCNYLHSGPIGDMAADALRSSGAAYKLIGIFLGIPNDIMQFHAGAVTCIDPLDPRYIEFYKPHMTTT